MLNKMSYIKKGVLMSFLEDNVIFCSLLICSIDKYYYLL